MIFIRKLAQQEQVGMMDKYQSLPGYALEATGRY